MRQGARRLASWEEGVGRRPGARGYKQEELLQMHRRRSLLLQRGGSIIRRSSAA